MAFILEAAEGCSEKFVVFAHHRAVLDSLHKGLGVAAVLVTGETPEADRAFKRLLEDRTLGRGPKQPIEKTYLAITRGVPTVGVRTEFHSTWLDNAKARFLLGWRPRYDLKRLVDEAWSYSRGRDEPRIVWYPG